MSHLSKRKLAFMCVFGAVAVFAIVLSVFFAKINTAEAQAIPEPECVPLKDILTGIANEVRVKVDSPATATVVLPGDPAYPFAVANSGVIDFENSNDARTITVGDQTIRSGVNIGVNHKACAEKWTDPNGNFKGYKLKGWEWNDNLGMVSFYCDSSGVNKDWYCAGGTYGVEIDVNGNSKGQIYVDNVGLINFTGKNTNNIKHTTKATYPADPNADRTIDVGNGWTWSDRVGWFDFSGTKWSGPGITQKCDFDGDGYYATGAIGCPELGGDCNDNNAAINPGAVEICGNGIDENCDGIDANCGGGGGGGTDNDNDTWCKENTSGCVVPPFDCDDTDPAVNPNAKEICDDGIDNDCNNIIDEGCIPADSEFKCGPAAITGSVKAQLGGAESTFSANREVIVKNIEKAKNMLGGIKCGWDNDQEKNVYYCENASQYLATIISDLDSDKSRTIIVAGGDLYINNNFYKDDGDAQLGVIALKDEYGNGGNVYIAHTVQKLQAQIFADSGVYSYDKDSGIKYDKIDNPVVPPVNDKFWKQLVIEGSITSRDNDDEDLKKDAPDKEYPYTSLKCLRPTKIIDQEKIPKVDGSGSTNSVVIKYQPPLKTLPVFGGISGAGTQQSN